MGGLRAGFVSGTTVLGRRTFRVGSSCPQRRSLSRVVCKDGNSSTDGTIDAKGRAKDLAVTYGPAFFATSTMSSVVSMSLWYTAVRSGVDVQSLVVGLGDWLSNTPVGRPSALDQINNSVGAFALAYIAHKASSPIRFPFVVAMTPYVAKVIKAKTTKTPVNDTTDQK